MDESDEADAPRVRDPLTLTLFGLLVLVALAGTLFCVGYALWWLINFWAPT